MIDVLSVDEQVILAATALMTSVIAVMISATLPRTDLQDFSNRNAMSPWHISFKVSIYHNQRDRSDYYYGPRQWRHFSRSQSDPHSYHDRSSSYRRHISCSSSNHYSSSHQWMLPSTLVLWYQQASSHPIPHLPLPLQVPLTPLHGAETVPFQQLSLHNTSISSQKRQVMAQTLNTP